MSTPTIPAGNLFMNATLYTGTGAAQTITNGAAGQSFQPDLYWGKRRDSAGQHVLTDSVRGVTKQLFSSLTDAEQTNSTYITSFNLNGVSMNTGNAATGDINTSGGSFVAWQWKAGGTAVSNTAGTITSQVSANTTSGFSVVTYTGNGTLNATIGHGLGATPSLVIIKNRGGANNWDIYHISNGAQKYMDFTTAAVGSLSTIFPTTPTSSVVYLGTTGGQNTNASTYVAYCWTPIAGYSAFGSYTGNGSATSGAFVYLGFRPRFVIIKRTDSTSSWIMIDSSRDPYNLAGQGLQANSSAAEVTPASSGYPIDLLSNGFKLYETGDPNVSSGTYIYAAFAENPFKYANAR
jgi:hypothetical protein